MGCEFKPGVIVCSFSGDGPDDCPEDANGRHYFIYGLGDEGRTCMDCGKPEGEKSDGYHEDR